MTGTIQAPIELKTPADFDHGLILVTRGGEPSNYLHAVSIYDGNEAAKAILQDAGYSWLLGWIERSTGRQCWQYTREFPLMVGEWAAQEKAAA